MEYRRDRRGAGVRLAVKAAMAVLAVLVPAPRRPVGDRPRRAGGTGYRRRVFGVLHHWDSYFLGVASDGYFPAAADASVQSFFPGYPAAARGVAALITFGAPTDTALTVAMWLVSAVASVPAAVLLWRLVQEEYPARGRRCRC